MSLAAPTKAFAPLLHGAPSLRPRGRPPGARAQVVRDNRALGIHHFAFVRASLLGLDLRASFERYLAWADTTSDLRHIQHRRDTLLKQIVAAGHALNAALPPDGKITSQLELLRSATAVQPAVSLPTLDDWVAAEGLDPDAWSEAELLAEYQAAFGLDNEEALTATPDVSDLAAQRVKALNHLATLLAVLPTATDRLAAWLAPPVVQRLRAVGLLTLGDLVRFINVYGYRWHGRIKGFGRQRAQQLVVWLRAQSEQLQLPITDRVDEPAARRALKHTAQAALSQLSAGSSGLSAPLATVPLTQFGVGSRVEQGLRQLQESPLLAGSAGVFRSHMANTLGARNDLEAVNAWLAYYQDKVSTQRSYRKEAERFLLWCTQVLQKPLSSITSPDCLQYRAFLQAVPTSWIEAAPVARDDPRWRAFRGQPGLASQKQALVILQALFGALCDAGYLVANPMKALMKGFDLPASKLDLRRSFTEAEWNHVLRCLAQLPPGPPRVRLHCLLALLVSTGLRLEELAQARYGDLRQESLPDLAPTWVLTVTGKRNKTREVPLQAEVVTLLAAHGQAFLVQDQQADPAAVPLLRTLQASVAQWGRSEEGALVARAVTEQGGSALSAAGIYAVLKRFFAQAAHTSAGAGLDGTRFEQASTHWLRHTFVRQALVDGVPIEVVSELAGHASIDTTSIYATQELARKIKAVQQMTRRVGA